MVRAQTESYRNTTPRARSLFQSIKSRREIERKHWEGDIGKQSCFLSTTCMIVYFIFTFANSHCSTHRRFRGGSSSSESEGWGVGGNAGWEPATPSSFRPDFWWSDNFSPSKAATLNDNCSGSICKTKGGMVLVQHWHETLKLNKWLIS